MVMHPKTTSSARCSIVICTERPQGFYSGQHQDHVEGATHTHLAERSTITTCPCCCSTSSSCWCQGQWSVQCDFVDGKICLRIHSNEMCTKRHVLEELESSKYYRSKCSSCAVNQSFVALLEELFCRLTKRWLLEWYFSSYLCRAGRWKRC